MGLVLVLLSSGLAWVDMLSRPVKEKALKATSMYSQAVIGLAPVQSQVAQHRRPQLYVHGIYGILCTCTYLYSLMQTWGTLAECSLCVSDPYHTASFMRIKAKKLPCFETCQMLQNGTHAGRLSGFEARRHARSRGHCSV